LAFRIKKKWPDPLYFVFYSQIRQRL